MGSAKPQRRDFNPRSRKGSDVYPGLFLDRAGYFNPRSRKGSDVSEKLFEKTFQDFNPRSRKGSDYTPHNFLLMRFIFQSTLPQGERL